MQASSSFHERLNMLIEATSAPNGKPWTNAEIARRMTTANMPITSTYVAGLRSGKDQNPAWLKVQALAEVFGVSITYFSPSDDGADLLESLRARNVTEVAFRAASLGEDAKRKLLDFVDLLRAAENGSQQSDHTPENGQ